MSFAERIGAVLIAPARAMEAAAAAPAGQGARDVVWLVAARLVAGEAPRLVRAGARLGALGFGAGVQGFAAAASQVLPDVVGILIAAMLMSLFTPVREKASDAKNSNDSKSDSTGKAQNIAESRNGDSKKGEAKKQRAASVDVAAYAWVPYLAVELTGALIFTALGRVPSPAARYVTDGIALAWAALVWALGLRALRRAGAGA